MKIGDLGEFEFIRSIMDGCLFRPERVIKGIGDDCAVLGPLEGKALLVTTDLLVEDVHFILSKISPDHLGQKAAAVNLSDIAAMGGDARHLFVSIAVPRSMNVETLHDIYGGIKTLCRRYRVNLLGGDTSASPDRLVISIAAVGEMPEDEVLYRGGARPGDLLFVTGTLGDSLAGLRIIKGECTAPEPVRSELIRAHHLPVPFLEAGRAVARSRLASAMIDLSDGLVADLGHVCEESGTGAEIRIDLLPVSGPVKALAQVNGLDPLELALWGGEDYRLLIAVPRRDRRRFEEMFRENAPCRVYPVGEILKERGIRILDSMGGEFKQRGMLFDHFKKR
jgi:thiamine-monophosphate kinase